ncbi:MAG: HesA/MoeB/ThiF family protein [Candidatus Bilamarchaeum sp.]|jgi:adenylyltransferase/sulfurtransferase
MKKPDFYSEKFMRNGLSKKNQQKIKSTKFCIIGLGGTGGVVLENLVRLGAQKFILFDNDRFELTNFNRQIICDDLNLDQEKSHAALKRAKSINPNISAKICREFTSSSSFGGAKIVFDCTDNVQSKLKIAKKCRKSKLPYVFCSANDTRGIVTIFLKYKFEQAFAIPSNKQAQERYQTCSTIICPSVMVAGSLAVSSAINYLFGLPYLQAPEALFFNLSRQDIFWKSKLG